MTAIPDAALVRIRELRDRRVPAESRHEVRVDASVAGRSVTIVERRAPWEGDPADPAAWSRTLVAHLRYDPDSSLWALYSPDARGRWRAYDAATGAVAELLDEIDEGPEGVFWG